MVCCIASSLGCATVRCLIKNNSSVPSVQQSNLSTKALLQGKAHEHVPKGAFINYGRGGGGGGGDENLEGGCKNFVGVQKFRDLLSWGE